MSESCQNQLGILIYWFFEKNYYKKAISCFYVY